MSLKYEYQEEFLDFCTGVKGVKILYDSFFKEIMNPEYTPGRLSELISLLIGQNVRVLKVLPNDSTRIADETSLVIMDIVVELEDHSITNIEIQKIGYAFPGQRSACYSSDLLLRQYKRVRGVNILVSGNLDSGILETDIPEDGNSLIGLFTTYQVVRYCQAQSRFAVL